LRRKKSFPTADPVHLEKQDGIMIDNEDIGRDIDLLTDQVIPLHDSPLTTAAKMCLSRLMSVRQEVRYTY
jgi:hypothetical protein